MNAEQKQRAAELLAAWRATAYALHGDRMANLLQELIDAPEDIAPAHLIGLQPVGELQIDAAPPAPAQEGKQ